MSGMRDEIERRKIAQRLADEQAAAQRKLDAQEASGRQAQQEQTGHRALLQRLQSVGADLLLKEYIQDVLRTSGRFTSEVKTIWTPNLRTQHSLPDYFQTHALYFACFGADIAFPAAQRVITKYSSSGEGREQHLSVAECHFQVSTGNALVALWAVQTVDGSHSLWRISTFYDLPADLHPPSRYGPPPPARPMWISESNYMRRTSDWSANPMDSSGSERSHDISTLLYLGTVHGDQDRGSNMLSSPTFREDIREGFLDYGTYGAQRFANVVNDARDDLRKVGKVFRW